MADIVIRPSMKFIKAGYGAVLIVMVAAIVVHYQFLAPEHPFPWLPIAAAFLLLWPIKHHVQRQTVTITIAGDKLRYETGVFSKSTRIIQLPKVQDVRVVQSFGQRIFGVGDISIETAGEHSALVVENLDQPRQLAEQITDASGAASASGVH